MFAVSGILFNHESPLRGQEFVTRKITNTVAKIKLGKLEVLELGNLNAQRDWGYAKEYVEGMWLMLQAKQPKDYVLATGQCETVRNFVTNAFSVVGINLEWSGEGVNEVAKDKASGKIHVKINENFYRPAEVELLKGCANKAQKELAWQPKTSLRQLCQMMVESDIEKNLKGISF